MIWFGDDITPDKLQPLSRGTMGEALGILFTEVGEDFLRGTMPVDARTKQPYGLLHGGASVALAETLGSVASAMVVDREKYYCVGVEINANHMRGVNGGLVTGTAKPLHLGKRSHVWDIRIVDEKSRLVCVSRLTTYILKRDTLPSAKPPEW